MSIFVYRPRSGDRVFAYLPTTEVGIVHWSNGCRHIFGGVHLTLCPGGQGSPRLLARRLGEDLVTSHGGIAWDEQGVVHVVTTQAGAFRAVDHIRSLDTASLTMSSRPVVGSGLLDPRPQLYLQGRATLTAIGFEESPVLVAPPTWTDLRVEEGPPKIVEPSTPECDAVIERRAIVTVDFGADPDLVRGTALVPASWIEWGGRWRCGVHDVSLRDHVSMDGGNPPYIWGVVKPTDC